MLALFLRIVAGLSSRIRNVWYRFLGCHIIGYCWIRKISIPRNWSDIRLERCSIDDCVTLLTTGPPSRGKISVESGVYINRYTIIDVSEKLVIGRNSMIGPFCYLTDHDHGRKRGERIGTQPLLSAPTIIGQNVWLGAGVIVLKGVNIGDNAVVGAGAVVTRDIPAGAVVIGVPARVIGGPK